MKYFFVQVKNEIIKSCHSSFSSVRSHFYFKIDLVFTNTIKRNVQNPVPKKQKIYSIVKNHKQKLFCRLYFHQKKRD